MQYIIYIHLPTNKVVLDKHIRSILVNLKTQRDDKPHDHFTFLLNNEVYLYARRT